MESTTIYPGEVFTDTKFFDTGIRQLVPYYDQMLEAIAACIPHDARRLLELGCGTGELSLKLLKRCPDAHLVAMDYSPRMIKIAQSKLIEAQLNNRVTLIQADFGAWANEEINEQIKTDFDGCFSSLAIHHLDNQMKQNLFNCIRNNLSNGGCFWNADPIIQESEQLQESYLKLREKWTQTQGKTIADVRSLIGNSQPQGYSGQDRLATLDTHLSMLKLAGFKSVAVPWRFFGLAIFGGWV